MNGMPGPPFLGGPFRFASSRPGRDGGLFAPGGAFSCCAGGGDLL